MRRKDQGKRKAILQASIEVINRLGFSGASVSAIAARAQLSPGTIYLYFANKEEVLNQAYLMVKQEFGGLLLEFMKINAGQHTGDDLDFPWTYTYLRGLMNSCVRELIRRPQEFLFIEQFANSPLILGTHRQEGREYFRPFFDYFIRIRSHGLVMDGPENLLVQYIFAPMFQLVKMHLLGEVVIDDRLIGQMADLSWRAISLEKGNEE